MEEKNHMVKKAQAVGKLQAGEKACKMREKREWESKTQKNKRDRGMQKERHAR